MWVKNITDFGRFCNLNIPCLRINITVIFLLSMVTVQAENKTTEQSGLPVVKTN